MGYIAKEINRVIGVYHLKSHILSGKYMDDFRERIVKRYCDTNTTFIWESPVFPPVHPGTCKQTLLLYLCKPRKTVRCTPYPTPHPYGKYRSGVWFENRGISQCLCWKAAAVKFHIALFS